MMRKFGAILFAVLIAAGLVHAQQPTLPARSVKKAPWVVPVVHVVDFHKMLERMRQRQGVRIGEPGAAPQNIINVVTGLVVDDNGHVVTRLANLDPEDNDQKISITTGDGYSRPARLVGVDYATGFVVLQVESLKVSLPDSAIASAPTDTTEVNILSADFVPKAAPAAKARRIYISPSIKVSSGKVEPGSIYSKARGALTLYSNTLLSRNDGSIVTNSGDQIVGIAQYAGFGRAHLFPVSLIRDTIVKRVLEKNGSVPAGWLGVTGISVAQLPHDQREPLGLTRDSGVVVREVVPEGPAALSGLKPDDVILSVGDYEVIGTADLIAMLSSSPAGRSIQLKLIRARQPLEIGVILGARAQEVSSFDSLLQGELLLSQRDAMVKRREELGNQLRAYYQKERTRETNEVINELSIEIRQLQENLSALNQLERDQRRPDQPGIEGHKADNQSGNPQVSQIAPALTFPVGFVGTDLTPQLAAFFGATNGILVNSVQNGSVAESSGLKAGDVIVEVQGQEPLNASQLKAFFSAQQGSYSIKIVRKKQPITIAIEHK